MNHPFIAGIGSDKCAKCKYPMLAHTEQAQCETCPNIGPVEIRYGNILMCAECWTRESNLKIEPVGNDGNGQMVTREKSFNAQAALLDEARKINDAIEVRTDVFNAGTMAIIDVKKTIDDNPEITNKPYALAEHLLKDLSHFKDVIFQSQEKIVDANNRIRSIQVYMNNLANELRKEEREKLKIADINYNPSAIKPSKPKLAPIAKPASKKIDKVALKKYATELGISEFMLQQIVVAKGVTVEAAAEIIKKSIAAAKSEG
jgi:hypothetical protein